MKTAFILYFSILSLMANSQISILKKASSFHKKRTILTTTFNTTTFSSSFIALKSVWYADYEKTPLHSFDDSKNWMQMDKVGHLYSCYHFNEVVSKTYQWSGLNNKKSALIGGAYAWTYQFAIELLDGQSSGWGFSWSDLTANTLGSALYIGQEYAFEKQIFKLKFSYQDSEFAQYRPNTLGSNLQEKVLKDYNAQTYWLSFSPFAWSKKEKAPKWLNLAFGYSVDGKLIGDQDFFTSVDGLKTFKAKREFILSLDIDVKNLPIKKKWLKAALTPFNVIKIPLPALVWRGNVLYGEPFYF